MIRTVLNSSLAAIAAALLAACSPAPEPVGGAPAGGDFILHGPQGPVDSRALRGKLLLVYFGYVNCPDVCPASLAVMNQVLNAMPEERRQRIQPILISVDPARDTPDKLVIYTAYFHPSLIGVTGSEEEVARVAGLFGAGYARQPARPDGSYAVDHSANTYVVAPSGKLVATIPIGMPADEVAAIVARYL
ncbi:MAG: SCO family protein [Rhodocyclaceae bacterium]|nr:SCO family protein [Rhodocyclaceae bacterium]